jgi:hypothetical protein
MREYGRVHSAFWSSADVQTFSDDSKLLALYLLTCAHGTIAGVCRLPDGYASEDLKWSSERVAEGFEELFQKGFANRCETTKWVWVRKFLEWNPPENPNQWKAVWKVVAQIPEKCSWRFDFLKVLSAIANGGETPNPNTSETLSEPFPNLISTATATATQQEETTAAEPPARTAIARVPRDTDPEWFLDFKLAYPDRAGDQKWRSALKAANARMAEGHTPADFIDGAKRYAEHCRASGKLGTEYVKQAATFLGPEKPFLLPWKPPRTKAERSQDSNIEAGLAWLEESNARQ